MPSWQWKNNLVSMGDTFSISQSAFFSFCCAARMEVCASCKTRGRRNVSLSKVPTAEKKIRELMFLAGYKMEFPFIQRFFSFVECALSDFNFVAKYSVFS